MTIAWGITHKKKQNTHICPIKKKSHRLCYQIEKALLIFNVFLIRGNNFTGQQTCAPLLGKITLYLMTFYVLYLNS